MSLCGVTKGKQTEGNTLHCTIWNENPNFLPNVLSTKQIVSQFSELRSQENSGEISLKNLTQDSNLSAVYSSIITHSRSELLSVLSWHPFIRDKTCLVQTYTENFLQINMICMQRLPGGDQGQVSTDRHWWSSDQVDSPGRCLPNCPLWSCDVMYCGAFPNWHPALLSLHLGLQIKTKKMRLHLKSLLT